MPRLWIAALAVFCLNVPFGFWRAGVRKFSLPWFLAVHLPVPLVVGIRFLAGLGFQLVTYPVLVGAFFGGQYLGGRLRALRSGVPQDELETGSTGGDA
jgi:hypothetical protein